MFSRGSVGVDGAQGVHPRCREVEAAPDIEGHDLLAVSDHVLQALIGELAAVSQGEPLDERASLEQRLEGRVPDVEARR